MTIGHDYRVTLIGPRYWRNPQHWKFSLTLFQGTVGVRNGNWQMRLGPFKVSRIVGGWA